MSYPPPLVMTPPPSLWQATSRPPLSGPCSAEVRSGQVRSAYQDGLYAGKGWVTMLAPTAVTYGQEAG